MKNPEEYLESFSILKHTEHYNYTYLYNKINEAIKQSQIDTYNEALDDAVNNAKGFGVIEDTNIPAYTPNIDIRIDKQSILKLKK